MIELSSLSDPWLVHNGMGLSVGTSQIKKKYVKPLEITVVWSVNTYCEHSLITGRHQLRKVQSISVYTGEQGNYLQCTEGIAPLTPGHSGAYIQRGFPLPVRQHVTTVLEPPTQQWWPFPLPWRLREYIDSCTRGFGSRQRDVSNLVLQAIKMA